MVQPLSMVNQFIQSRRHWSRVSVFSFAILGHYHPSAKQCAEQMRQYLPVKLPNHCDKNGPDFGCRPCNYYSNGTCGTLQIFWVAILGIGQCQKCLQAKLTSKLSLTKPSKINSGVVCQFMVMYYRQKFYHQVCRHRKFLLGWLVTPFCRGTMSNNYCLVAFCQKPAGLP